MWPDWEVVDHLGSGTFGSVYEIHRKIFSHTDKAALKVLSIPKSKSDIQELLYNGYDQKSITERFKNHLEDIVKEYALMSQLKGCANVVYSDDIRYVQHEDGIGWDIHIKMELLQPLIAVLKNPVDQKQVIKIGIDICNALELCKEKNIVHRDIKPQNLFVSENGTFKLGDFGIAKTAEKTMGGTKTGTFNYMAPEVYNNQPYGVAADQYSLGMVLYWLLNERRMPFFPLPPEIPTASQEELARQRRLSGEMPPEPKHGSAAMKSIVMRAIAPNPADRFPSPTDMKNALMMLDQIESGFVQSELISEVEAHFEEEPYEPSIDPAVVVIEDFSDEPLAEIIRDEEIPVADSTVGNSWFFDEGSVGPGAGFNNLFDDFKTDGTIGAWDDIPNKEVPKKENFEEIKPKAEGSPHKKETAVTNLKPISVNENGENGMVFYEVLREDRFDPACSLSGYTCLFYVDRGNTATYYFNEPKIKCDEGSQWVPLPAMPGIHQLTVKIFGPNDPKCTDEPVYICGPMNFEVRPKQTTRIKVTRPISKTPMSVEISSDFAEPVTVTAVETSSIDLENAMDQSNVADVFKSIFGEHPSKVGTVSEMFGKSEKEAPAEKKGTVIFSALNDNHSPLSLAHGCFYKFTVDGGNKIVDGRIAEFNNYVVKCGRKEESTNGTAAIGKPHTVELKIYQYNDPEFKGRIVHQFGPVAFEVKEGYKTIIKANRPSPTKKINVTVSYEKN